MNKVFKGIVIIEVLLFIGMLSCKPASVPPYQDEEKLIALLADLHMMEMALFQGQKHDQDSLALLYRTKLFDIHDVTEDSVQKILLYLDQNPEDYYRLSLQVADTTEAAKKAFVQENK